MASHTRSRSPSVSWNPYKFSNVDVTNITLDPSWVKVFNQNGVRLIMAKVFKDPNGQDYFNVVASANGILKHRQPLLQYAYN